MSISVSYETLVFRPAQHIGKRPPQGCWTLLSGKVVFGCPECGGPVMAHALHQVIPNKGDTRKGRHSAGTVIDARTGRRISNYAFPVGAWLQGSIGFHGHASSTFTYLEGYSSK